MTRFILNIIQYGVLLLCYTLITYLILESVSEWRNLRRDSRNYHRYINRNKRRSRRRG